MTYSCFLLQDYASDIDVLRAELAKTRRIAQEAAAEVDALRRADTKHTVRVRTCDPDQQVCTC